MLDQNMTTIITTIITVIGTLSGVVLGVVLSNRYVVRQEKEKRNTVAIEEAYTILTKISKQIVENIDNDEAVLANQVNDVDRLETLVYLYLHNLEKDFDAYKQSLYMLAIKDLNCKSENRHEIWKIISEEYATYNEKKDVLKSKLEKLVR